METKTPYNLLFALGMLSSCNTPTSLMTDSSLGEKLASLPRAREIKKHEPVNDKTPKQYFNSEIALQKILANYPQIIGREILIDKSERKLGLYLGKKLLKEYPVSLGFDPENDKVQEGDGRTPEGEFYINIKIPHTRFHKALQISYPLKEDALRGLETDLINHAQYWDINQAIDGCKSPPQRTSLGGHIQIHGGGTRSRDWTLGCIALENNAIDEIYYFAQGGCRGTKIRIQR